MVEKCQKVVKKLSNLEKNNKSNDAIVEQVRWCKSNKNSEKMKKKIGGS
jgi:hypothetical protein